MTITHKVIFYPVGNGDTSQVVMANGTRILFDFCHRGKSEDVETPEIDLKKRLGDELKAAKRNYFDVVAFTHADEDHINGFSEFFELEHASKYQGEGRIKIQELWIPAAVLLESGSNDQQSNEYILLRQEARHRLVEGVGIRVFSKPPALMEWLKPKLKERNESEGARDHLFVDAGTLVPGFTLKEDNVEFFAHSPFIKHCEDGDVIRNESALVINVRFKVEESYFDYLEVGDSTWDVLEDIVRTTKEHKNDSRLDWNLFNIPHHCSYLALSDEKGERETEPKPFVRELLKHGKRDSYIVSCSKPIPDSADSYSTTQPPHIQARKAYEKYLKEVSGRKFLVTMEEPNARRPEPIIFEIGSGGITWKKSLLVGAPAIVSSSPPRAGI